MLAESFQPQTPISPGVQSRFSKSRRRPSASIPLFKMVLIKLRNNIRIDDRLMSECLRVIQHQLKELKTGWILPKKELLIARIIKRLNVDIVGTNNQSKLIAIRCDLKEALDNGQIFSRRARNILKKVLGNQTIFDLLQTNERVTFADYQHGTFMDPYPSFVHLISDIESRGIRLNPSKIIDLEVLYYLMKTRCVKTEGEFKGFKLSLHLLSSPQLPFSPSH